MKKLSLIAILIVVMGCSNKTTSLDSKDIKYQRFLSYQADKKLNSEMENYE